MARRRSQDDALVGFAGILFAALVVLIFILRLAATVAFFTLPLALFGTWIATFGLDGRRLGIPDFTDFDDVSEAQTMGQLLFARQEMEDVIDEQYNIGRDHLIDLTQSSDYQRFDQRPRLGRELNRKIDDASQERDNLSTEINILQYKMLCRLPDTGAIIRQWMRVKALHNSSIFGLIALICMSTLSFRGDVFPAQYADKAAKVLLWDPLPHIPKGQLVLSSATAFLMTGFSAILFAWLAWLEIDKSTTARWREMRMKWSTTEAFYLVADDDECIGSEEELTEDNWSDILGCDTSSTPDEIKSAYKRAMKAYHPDQVASLGPKLRELAESESKKINTAFAEAKRELGFH